MNIGIDIDEVLVDTNELLTKFHNDNYGTNICREDYKNYGLGSTWGCTEEEAVSRVLEAHNTQDFIDAKPLKDAVEALDKLSKKNTLYAITSRHKELHDHTIEWVENNFPETFKELIFSDHVVQRMKNKLKTKAEICLEKEIEILIEDCLEYAIECAEKGIKVFLIDYPWNQLKEGEKEHEKVIRVKNWREILEKID